MNLENLNLVELNNQEVQEVDGGSLLKKFTWGYIATEIIDNWDDIKKGWNEGWADAAK